jgi:hypothetical protein
MQTDNFGDILKHLPDHEITIHTLGRKRYIRILKIINSIRIENSKNNTILIDLNHWNKVMNRVNELNINERLKTSRYAHGSNDYNWPEAPDRIFSPYVPAILRYMNEKSK